MRRAVIGGGAVLLLLVAGCAGEDPQPPPPASPSSEPSEPAQETTEPSPEPFDPTSVDLGEQEWQYATAYQAPVPVQLSGGEGTGELDQGEGRFELGEDDPLYVDMDADGDEDVIASLSFSADLGGGNFQWVATTWFVWLNDGEQLTQLPYPLAGSGDCDTQVASVAAADGGGVVIEEAQLGWQSPCAMGANIEVTRTVQVTTGADDEPWLVQTEPFPSWGGACPMMIEPGDSDGEVLVAPGMDPASPQTTPVIVDGADSWLDEELDGWDFVTYLQDQDPNFVSYCGWTQS